MRDADNTAGRRSAGYAGWEQGYEEVVVDVFDEEEPEAADDGPFRPVNAGAARRIAWRVLRPVLLLVALTSLVFWWRSDTQVDYVRWVGQNGDMTRVISLDETLVLLHVPGTGGPPTPPVYGTDRLDDQPRDFWQAGPWRTLGIEFGRGDPSDPTGGPARTRWVFVRWLNVAFLAALPLVVGKAYELRRRDPERDRAGPAPATPA